MSEQAETNTGNATGLAPAVGSDSERGPGLYIQLISVHGLIRGTAIEMGRDADTGGQVRYVIELARTLAAMPGVDRVDLITRKLRDKAVSDDYAQEIEPLDEDGSARIVRLPCGGGKYLRKERLWPLLDELADNLIAYTRQQDRLPDLIHGHYADAGYVAHEVATVFDLPLVFTGHSLGRPKLEYLQSEGWSLQKANRELNIEHRSQVEQDVLAASELVICSTRHERDTQYGHYVRDGGLRIEVVPPGTDLFRFFPAYEYEMNYERIDEAFKQARIRMQNKLARFHLEPDKPLILSLCRPDRRKNIQALIEAYGQSKELQAIANLAVFAGIREDIEEMNENEREVLTDILLLMDRYDLYGKLAIPKQHDSEFEVPELYRLAASGRGVFVNSAFIELFGLTAIEAAACGLPFVVTENGGPQDIVENCECGLLVDTTDRGQMTAAIKRLLTEPKTWDKMSDNGVNRVREHYSWEAHCEKYLGHVRRMLDEFPKRAPQPLPRPGRRLAQVEALLITDIDNTLIGDQDGDVDAMQELLAWLRENRDRIGFGVATGRGLELVDEIFAEQGVDEVDIVVSAVGSEIHYGREFVPDKGWAARLRHRWKRDAVRDVLDGVPFLRQQDDLGAMRDFKISYVVDDEAAAAALSEQPDQTDLMTHLHGLLDATKSAYTLIHSHGKFIDVLPHRASKGKAVRYLGQKWQVRLDQIVTAGDSGNDREMLQGRTAGIVVGNHDPELADLKEASRVYFAENRCSAGILEGLRHFGFIE